MIFLADMGISPRTVNWLKAAGYDAIHLAKEGLGGVKFSHTAWKCYKKNSY